MPAPTIDSCAIARATAAQRRRGSMAADPAVLSGTAIYIALGNAGGHFKLGMAVNALQGEAM
jgi:hypothetical protein